MARSSRFKVQVRVGQHWMPAHRGTVSRSRAEAIKSQRRPGDARMKAVRS